MRSRAGGWAHCSAEPKNECGGGYRPLRDSLGLGLCLINVSARLKFDPFTRKLYATVPSTATQVAGNSLIAFDPASGSLASLPILLRAACVFIGETLAGSANPVVLSYGSNRYVLVGMEQLTGAIQGQDLVRWGRDGLAWHSSNDGAFGNRTPGLGAGSSSYVGRSFYLTGMPSMPYLDWLPQRHRAQPLAAAISR
jgi:hypothetical protein